MRFRSLAIGLALLTSGTIIGAASSPFVSADVESGDRPVLVPIEPCRLVDTRPGAATVGPRSTKLGAADTYTVDAQEPDTPCSGKIPADARSLSLNVTAIAATAQSFVTVWAGGDRPDASSLNPAPGQPPTPNAVTTELSADQEFDVYNDSGSINLLVDVNGYYVNHNHDDRYYTRAEVDAVVAATPDPVTVSPVGFGLVGANWTVTSSAVRRSNGGTLSCVQADLHVPTGAQIEAVTLRYQAIDSSDLRVRVQVAEVDTFDFALAFNETTSLVPTIYDKDLSVARLVNASGLTTIDGGAHSLELCTDAYMFITGTQVEFS